MKRWMKQRVVLVALLLTIMLLAAILKEGEPIWTVFSARRAGATLVLDAGHGGMDGGAVSADGTCEQDINLAIVRRCEALAGLFGIPTVLTRADGNSIDYDPSSTVRANKVADIRARERITNSQSDPVFVSVHLNKFTDSVYSGAQVFWSPNHADSKTLAEAIQSSLTAGLKPDKERVSKRAVDSIYLMKHLTCPAVIVECGFLSNAAETQKLKQDGYQTRLALCIVSGYLNDLQTSSADAEERGNP